jgi:fructose-1,6-bisphosphatase/inositol monophosphatase family enzyme
LADALDALLERYASSALDNAASALLARRVGGALRSVYGHHLGLFAL